MTEHRGHQPPLPGLEPPAPSSSALELAARRTIAELHRLQLLDERHALTCQLILDLAQSVAASSRHGRASAAAMAAAQLREAFATLPEPVGGDDDDAFTQLANDLRAAATRNPADLEPHQ